MKTLLNRRRFVLIILLYTLFALAALVIAPLIGSEPIDIKTVLNDLTGGSNSWTTDTRIFIYQRIPRVSLGFLAGGTLALVGSVFQVILRNPLAAPSTLGVTGGGSVGAILAISLPWLSLSWGPFSTVQLFALAGSALI
ncbi:MAG: iron chelate uptake ABC transporter family permease subunit, partial [Sedimentisphaerales bacterium]|nr:iron chelate uptake ABC transporter family permease subunit [Sedimentisphaerales bacterium]